MNLYSSVEFLVEAWKARTGEYPQCLFLDSYNLMDWLYDCYKNSQNPKTIAVPCLRQIPQPSNKKGELDPNSISVDKVYLTVKKHDRHPQVPYVGTSDD